jgi:hypothetical protein
MLFSPKTYDTLSAMCAESFFDCHSDTQINGVDVFGYVNDTPYSAQYETEVGENNEEVTWVTAGVRID